MHESPALIILLMGSKSSSSFKGNATLDAISSIKLERIKRVVEQSDLNLTLRQDTSVRYAVAEPEDCTIDSSAIWKQRCSIIVVVTRPGCPLC